MDQETVRRSLERHLEVIEKTALWAVAIAIIVGWAIFRGEPSIEIEHLKATRSDAYTVLSFAFILANLAILIALLRMSDLLDMLKDGEDFSRGIEQVMTHQFLFSPFAYFGSGWRPWLYGSAGYGLLILCWWICYAVLASLRGYGLTPNFVEAVLLLMGICSTFAIHRYYIHVITRLSVQNPDYANIVRKTERSRGVMAVLFSCLGLLLFIWVQLFVSFNLVPPPR